MTPAVVMRPIWLAPSSVNQRLPSAPTAMSMAPLVDVGIGYSVMGWPMAIAANARH